MYTRLAVFALLITLALTACDDDSEAPPPPISFAYGVAAGDVTADSAVLWTRAENAGHARVELMAEGATSSRTFDVDVSAEGDYIARIRVDGLRPNARYTYRFRSGDAVSEAGRFVTPPDPATSKPVRFVFGGDSDGTRDASGAPAHGAFEVLRAAAAETPAFFLYLGDTIYADRGAPASTLEAYRAKYRANREYAALRELLAQTSVVAMWDDHEVRDNFTGATVDPDAFANGSRAFRDYWPIVEGSAGDTLHVSLRWGKEVELIVLDTRSARSASSVIDCEGDPLPAGAADDASETLRGVRAIAQLPETLRAACFETLNSPARRVLGSDQKAFVFDRLRNSDATWKIVATSVPMQALLFAPYDRWEGYPAERREVLEFIRANEIENVVFLSTDLHASVFGPVRIDPFDGAPPVAYEAIVGPIAAETLEQDIVDVLGEGGAGLLGPFLTGIVGVDCAELDSFAYGLVEADATSLTITAKDASGRALCTKTLEAA